MALRIKTGNSAPVYLDKPGYREKLMPSKRRNLLAGPVGLSIGPVMQSRKEVVWESLFADETIDDETAAWMLRLGAGAEATAPDPGAGGGYYLFVANGTMDWNGSELPLWSMVVVEANEQAPQIRAGSGGLELLIMQYPREAD